ncbi:tyrosine-type recombinase/integrase [Vibrio sp. La 4.2.2]|uniref:tyrosine-type recombinase/integrase n=1 Tax=Vibrio sp. La 4.2.2 TaxID=2998830 RepID=UPI0022CE1F8E|nr:tyrosine-type recombinase/integrase [Vibrio sp. La 4.2.2]MDA0108998.1 tyrosine-type recombinase/integrase [Vibrio sp. La 4.2.2]
MDLSAPDQEMKQNIAEPDLVDLFLTWKQENENCSTRTISKYRGLLKQFGEYIDNDFGAAELKTLEQFSGGWLHRAGYSAASRKVAVAALRGFYSFLAKRHLIDKNPAVELVYPKIGRKLPRFMGLKSAETLLLQPDLDSLSGLRDSAMLALLIGCGFRVAGLCGLNESQLIWYQYGEVERLAIKTLEKGERERVVPVPLEAMLLVQAYMGHPDLKDIDRVLENGDSVLFVNLRNRHVPEWEHRGELRRLSCRAVDRMIKRYAIAAGVPEDQAHAHAMRHLFGTELAESDSSTLQIQALMGHADPKTSEIYTHISMRKMTHVLDKGNPLSKMDTPVTALLQEMKKGKRL